MGNTTSVNELNCWKAIAASTNQASFIEVFGRDPHRVKLKVGLTNCAPMQNQILKEVMRKDSLK